MPMAHLAPTASTSRLSTAACVHASLPGRRSSARDCFQPLPPSRAPRCLPRDVSVAASKGFGGFGSGAYPQLSKKQSCPCGSGSSYKARPLSCVLSGLSGPAAAHAAPPPRPPPPVRRSAAGGTTTARYRPRPRPSCAPATRPMPKVSLRCLESTRVTGAPLTPHCDRAAAAAAGIVPYVVETTHPENPLGGAEAASMLLEDVRATCEKISWDK